MPRPVLSRRDGPGKVLGELTATLALVLAPTRLGNPTTGLHASAGSAPSPLEPACLGAEERTGQQAGLQALAACLSFRFPRLG